MRLKEKQAIRPSILLMIVAVASASITLFLAFQSNSITLGTNSNLPGLVADASSFGNQVSLTQAQSLVRFSFRAPTFLPAGTLLNRVYVSSDGSITRLFYNNSRLPDAAAFGGSLPFPAQVVIYAEISPTNPIPQFAGSDVPPIVVQAQNVNGGSGVTQTISQGLGGSLVSVCGNQGYGIDQTGGQAATLTWWANGVQYMITAKVPLSTIMSIGASMC